MGDLAAIQRMVEAPGVTVAPAGLPAGHPPVAATLPVATVVQAAGPLQYDVPRTWKQVKPSSAMRLAQYEIPPAPGDTLPGEVAVFHFPGAGGSVEDNIERWRAQFMAADGRPVDPSAVARETFEVGRYRVHFVEVCGYLAPGPTAGASRPAETEYRLLGAIVETPDGNWFFKGLGPSATMAAAREDMLAMLRSIRP